MDLQAVGHAHQVTELVLGEQGPGSRARGLRVPPRQQVQRHRGDRVQPARRPPLPGPVEPAEPPRGVAQRRLWVARQIGQVRPVRVEGAEPDVVAEQVECPLRLRRGRVRLLVPGGDGQRERQEA